MLKIISENFVAFFAQRVELNEDERMIISYRIRMIISDILMFSFLFFIFFWLDAEVEFIVSYFTMRLSRTQIGGIHRKTKTGCSAHTIVFFMTAYLLARIEPISATLMWIIVFGILDMLLAPCPSKERGTFGKKARLRMKILACVGLVICFLCCVLFPNYESNVIVTLQMVHFEFLLKNLTERRCGA